MRLTLHHRTIHESAWVALVTVADDILFFYILIEYLLPFAPSWESAASASTQRCLADLVHDLLRRHVEQRLCDRAVSAQRQILRDTLRIDPTTVLKRHARLLFIKWDVLLFYVRFQGLILIYQMIDNFIVNDTFLNNLFTVFQFHFQIQPAHRLDPKKRAHLTKSVATALFQSDAVIVRLLFKEQRAPKPLLFDDLLHLIINFQRSARHAARSGTDQDLFSLTVQGGFIFFLLCDQFFPRINHLPLPPCRSLLPSVPQ